MMQLNAPYSQDDLLALIARLLPEDYLQPLKSGMGPGYELFQMAAEIGARVSTAATNVYNGLFIGTATGGVLATVTVALSRQNAANGAVTVKAGTVITTDQAKDFTIDHDVAFTSLDLGPHNVTATAVAFGYEWNFQGPFTTAGGELVPGPLSIVKTPIQDPPYGDPTILVAQVNDATGGVPPMLDQLGDDRGITRQPGELDTQYRTRIRSLPDTVSPAAIRAAVTRYLAAYGSPSYEYIETWSLQYQTCWDGPPTPLPANMQGFYDPTLFVYDDPRPPIPFRNRWLDENDYRGAFIIVLPNLAAISDVGMAYDDLTGVNPVALTTPIGRRAACAYDVPTTLITSELQGGYDGFDLQKAGAYKGLFNLLQNIKAAGVSATIELLGQ